ncbi:MAG: hypothetical protein WD003_00360 [Candidatus Paceibacterota bacterium]
MLANIQAKNNNTKKGFTSTPFLTLLRGIGKPRESVAVYAHNKHLGMKGAMRHEVRKGSRGFTVIELFVTAGIFVLISGLLLANYGNFAGSTVINNLAHEVALSIRQAQVFGIGVQEFGVGSGLFLSHGIYYSSNDPTLLRLFADVDKDGKYEEGELAELFTLRKGNEIQRVCGYETTSKNAPCVELSELNVTFTRPNPEAIITGTPNAQYAYARITLVSPGGLTRDILVWANGQVSILQ